MKRLLIFAAVLSGVVSCELYGGYITQNTQQQLQKYTLDAFSGHVLMPVMMAELAVDFDAYLSLTDEDKAKDFRFYGNIRNPEEIKAIHRSYLKVGVRAIRFYFCFNI